MIAQGVAYSTALQTAVTTADGGLERRDDRVGAWEAPHHAVLEVRHGPLVAVLALVIAGGASAFVISHASSRVVQRQPPPGSCHVRGHYPFNMPDLHCTPGALNPAVTQATIHKTICRSGYSSSIRPSTSVTGPEKLASIRAYGFHAGAGSYEYDHLISLELGGAANDSRNLWPESGASPNLKDKVENYLHARVCDGRVSLARAQRIIALDWVTFYNLNVKPKPKPKRQSRPRRLHRHLMKASCTLARSARRRARPATRARVRRWCAAQLQMAVIAGTAVRGGRSQGSASASGYKRQRIAPAMRVLELVGLETAAGRSRRARRRSFRDGRARNKVLQAAAAADRSAVQPARVVGEDRHGEVERSSSAGL